MKTPKMTQRKTVDSNNQTWQRTVLLATDRSQTTYCLSMRCLR